MEPGSETVQSRSTVAVAHPAPPLSRRCSNRENFSSTTQHRRGSSASSSAERLVEREQVDYGHLWRRDRLVEHDPRCRAAPLAGRPPARVIDQDLPHQPRGHRKQAGAICGVATRSISRRSPRGRTPSPAGCGLVVPDEAALARPGANSWYMSGSSSSSVSASRPATAGTEP